MILFKNILGPSFRSFVLVNISYKVAANIILTAHHDVISTVKVAKECGGITSPKLAP
eukprot:SAG11_NODE_27864_length_328_cov_0.620087_1_plen_56_part_10